MTDTLAAYQIEKLRQTVEYAKENSTFYRAQLRGFSPPRTSNQLQQLPFTTAVNLAENGARMLCVPQDEISHVVTLQTSGTTGAPKKVYFTASELARTETYFLHGLLEMGLSAADSLLILFPCRRSGSVGDLLTRAGRCLGARVFPVGAVEDDDQVALLLARERITCVLGSPTQTLALAEATRLFQPLTVQTVLLSADYVSEELRRRVETLWSCTVYEHYGMTEMGFGGGIFCKERQGYHMREWDFYFEVVDEHGNVLSDGERGELVFTTLTRTGMPLIRYRTGDCTRFLTTSCACGSPLRLLERIFSSVAVWGEKQRNEAVL